MKTIRCFLGLPMVAIVLFWQFPCFALPRDFCITSPDRPPVWYNLTGDKLSEYLEWSSSRDQLLLHVAYANVASTPEVWREQSDIDTFELSFPTVHLDRSQNRLYFIVGHNREINIGHLQSGMLGTRVLLDDDVEFSAHRRNSVVEAAIVSPANGVRR